MRTLTTNKGTRLFSLLAALTLPATANAQIVLSNQYSEVSSLSITTVELYGHSELHITNSVTPISGCTIDMNSVDSWVFLDNVVPSGASPLLGQFRVSGAGAVLDNNVRIVEYGQGAVVIPYPADFQPMQVFADENFLGNSMSLSPYTAYGTAQLGAISVSSLVLKRGYTATLARNSDGTGVSVNYVAADGDLRIGALPDGLNNKVNFIRVFPWRWVSKKGSCDTSPTELNAKWHYNWDINQSSTPDWEYVAIRQQPFWPSLNQSWQALGVNHLLGYNEPNNPVEDSYKNLTPPGSVSDAVARWPESMATGLRIGTPAVTDGGYSWITNFVNQAEAAGYRMDYVPVHYYRSYPNNNNAQGAANNLYSYLKSIHDVVKRPIWVTEFNNGANWTTDPDPTFDQEKNVIEAMINMMDNTPWIERYSIYSAVEEVRQVYYNAGGYTPMGQMYKAHVAPLAYQQILPGEGMDPSGAYYFENNLNDDSGGGNNAVSKDYPDFVTGHNGGTALAFDGVDDHVILPDSLSDGANFTFAAWVYWDGGSPWQRIFDFGIMDSDRYMFLTPSADTGVLRFTITTSGWGGEQRLNAPSPLPQNTWTHVAVTLNGRAGGRLYVNGSEVASASITLKPSDLGAIQHYLGRSQFSADPYFSGKIDDVIIKNQALSATQIAALAAGNHPPQVMTNSIDGGSILPGEAYAGSVAGSVTDPDGGGITYSKVYGPSWLYVAANGTLSGTPDYAASGTQYFTLRATDNAGAMQNVNFHVTIPGVARSHYAFDGNLVDSVGGLDGTPATAPVFAEGNAGQGLVFDGTSNYVTLPSDVARYDKITIAAWVRWDGGSDSQHIFDFGNGTSQYMFLCPHNSAGHLRFAMNDGSVEDTLTAPTLVSGQWTHVAVTIDGNLGKLYVNGTLSDAYTGLSVRPSDFAQTLNYFGKSRFAADPLFNGMLDDVHIYNYPLTASEIADLAGVAPKAAGPTVAYWNFEEGTANTYVPYSPASDGQHDGSILDVSGNGNNLSAWSDNWEWYRTTVPAATTPQAGLANTLSVQNANDYNAISAIGTTLSSWNPAQWTIEAAYNTDRTTGFQTIVGRDSYGAYPGNLALSALYLSVRPGGSVAVQFTDNAGNNWNLESASGVVEVNQWQAIAAVSDGSTLSLYLKNITAAEPGYTLMGTLDISSSADSALTVGAGDGVDWDAGVFSVGRGLYGGGHVDRLFGYIDDVRLSEAALSPDQFLYNIPPAPLAPSDLTAIGSDSQVSLSWSAALNATSYKVQRSEFSGGPYSLVASPTGTTAVDVGLTDGTVYYYVVSAVGVSGESTNSTEASAIPSVAIAPEEYVISGHAIVGGTNLTLTVSNSVAGHLYQILATDGLMPSDWQPEGVDVAGSGSNIEFTIPVDETKTSRFFKLDVQRQ